jgi:hypothetical protein
MWKETAMKKTDFFKAIDLVMPVTNSRSSDLLRRVLCFRENSVTAGLNVMISAKLDTSFQGLVLASEIKKLKSFLKRDEFELVANDDLLTVKSGRRKWTLWRGDAGTFPDFQIWKEVYWARCADDLLEGIDRVSLILRDEGLPVNDHRVAIGPNYVMAYTDTNVSCCKIDYQRPFYIEIRPHSALVLSKFKDKKLLGIAAHKVDEEDGILFNFGDFRIFFPKIKDVMGVATMVEENRYLQGYNKYLELPTEVDDFMNRIVKTIRNPFADVMEVHVKRRKIIFKHIVNERSYFAAEYELPRRHRLPDFSFRVLAKFFARMASKAKYMSYRGPDGPIYLTDGKCEYVTCWQPLE